MTLSGTDASTTYCGAVKVTADRATLRRMVEDEQGEFVALLRGLTPGQWAAPSLCRRWSVRDVVIHIANHIHTPDLQRTAQLVRAGLSPTRHLKPYRDKSNDDLIDWLASPPTLRGRFNMRTQLAELTIHQQDVRRPLGIDRPIPAQRLLVLLDAGLTPLGSGAVASARTRAKGLRLTATDIGWSTGTGPEVRGPGEAIYMAINGRGHALQNLSGEGLNVLAGRVH